MQWWFIIKGKICLRSGLNRSKIHKQVFQIFTTHIPIILPLFSQCKIKASWGSFLWLAECWRVFNKVEERSWSSWNGQGMKIFVLHVNIQQRALTRESGLHNYVDKMTPALIVSLPVSSATLILAQWVHGQNVHCQRNSGYSWAQQYGHSPNQDWSNYCRSWVTNLTTAEANTMSST